MARWIELLSPFNYEIEYQEGRRHQNADAMSRRPCSDGCRWCKEWKKAERIVSIAVQTDVLLAGSDEVVVWQTESPHVEQNGAELSSAATKHFVSIDEPSTNLDPRVPSQATRSRS